MDTHYLQQLPEEWKPKARIFAALGDGTRQKMLLLFEADETITLKTLVDVVPLSRSAVVHHVTVLEQAGLLVARRQGREVGYTLNTDPLITSLEDVLDYAKKRRNIAGAVLGVAPIRRDAAPSGRDAVPSGRGVAPSGRDAERAHSPAGTLSQTNVPAGHTRPKTQPTSLFVPLSAQELAHD